MKKLPFFFIILIAVLALAAGDYYLNIKPNIGILEPSQPVSDPVTLNPNLTATILKLDPSQFGYQVANRSRTNQIFEKIDLSELKNLVIYENQLEPLENSLTSDPIRLYEIQGPEAQGSLTYLDIKLKFVDQISATESLNETGNLGNNSFYLNDENYENTTFLVTQIGNHVFGFQFNRLNPAAFETVQEMINAYKSSIQTSY